MAVTREEIEASYRVVGGKIVSPGEFQNEPVWAPHYWALVLEGAEDDTFDDGCGVEWSIFHIDASDVERWPELAGAETVALAKLDNGFVITAVTP